jgi:hypothetical protein
MLTAETKVDKRRFMLAAAKAFARADRQRIRPIYKGVVLRIVETLVEGGFGYGGLPQYTGNAVGNVQVGKRGDSSRDDSMSEDHRERLYNQEGQGIWADWEPYDNDENPNRSRMEKTLSRARGYLRSVKTPTAASQVLAGGLNHASTVYLPADYLENYVDWGGDMLWRTENLTHFPIAISRLRRRLQGSPQSFISKV